MPGRPENALSLFEQRIEKDRILAESTQRAVARGRHSVIETQRRTLLRDAARSSAPGPDGLTSAARARLRSRLARDLAGIHERLLLLSASVELEMDRLDVARAEVERLDANLTDPDRQT